MEKIINDLLNLRAKMAEKHVYCDHILIAIAILESDADYQKHYENTGDTNNFIKNLIDNIE